MNVKGYTRISSPFDVEYPPGACIPKCRRMPHADDASSALILGHAVCYKATGARSA
jgi:hypothetical protein